MDIDDNGEIDFGSPSHEEPQDGQQSTTMTSLVPVVENDGAVYSGADTILLGLLPLKECETAFEQFIKFFLSFF